MKTIDSVVNKCHIQLEFSFTKKGYIQQRAIKQDKFIQHEYEKHLNRREYRCEDTPVISLYEFEMSYGQELFATFAKIHPVHKDYLELIE